jgi:hypothetical protein
MLQIFSDYIVVNLSYLLCLCSVLMQKSDTCYGSFIKWCLTSVKILCTRHPIFLYVHRVFTVFWKQSYTMHKSIFTEKFGINGTWINATITSLAVVTNLHIYHKKQKKFSSMLLLRSYTSLSMDCQSQGRTDVDIPHKPQKRWHLSGLFCLWNKKEKFHVLQSDL